MNSVPNFSWFLQKQNLCQYIRIRNSKSFLFIPWIVLSQFFKYYPYKLNLLQLAAVQTGNMSFLLIHLKPAEQQEMQLTFAVKGIFVGEKNIAVWDYEQVGSKKHDALIRDGQSYLESSSSSPPNLEGLFRV